MARPIPVDILPSHVYLSQQDQATLFGVGHPMTIAQEHTQVGQVIYEEMVEVFGSLKRSLQLRIMGPNWSQSHVELTPTEAAFLGLKLIEEVKSGDLSTAVSCRLVGPAGEVKLSRGAIIPAPHLLCSPKEAEELRVMNGEKIEVDLVGERSNVLSGIIVRIHPTFRLRLEIHQDYARKLWITKPTHARIRE